MNTSLVKSNPLASALKARSNLTYTENGADTYASTLHSVLDFFYLAPARQRENNLPLFEEAWTTDPLLTLKATFYIRDTRGGKKQKKTFQDILHWLYKNEHDVFKHIIGLVPEYGYWKELTPYVNDKAVQKLVKQQLKADTQAAHPSLLGKWLPSENATSAETKRLARAWMKELHMTPKEYRKMLTSLRKRIDVVETHMSAQDWEGIQYERVPSKAFINYRKAFLKRDPSRFTSFVEAALASPQTKSINTGALYPHDIGSKLIHGKDDKALEAAWVNLPNFFGDEERNVLVVVDTSGSMDNGHTPVAPVNIAASLGMYCAERNKGAFQNMVITFSEHPTIHTVTGNTVRKRLLDIVGINNRRAENTNLQATFACILRLAIGNRVPPEDMPSNILIISDMEFDSCVSGGTNLNGIKEQYARAGYVAPMLTFWNVEGRTKQAPALANEKGVFLVSGFSAETIGKVLQSKAVTPLELMMETLNNERYSVIEKL